LYSILLLSKTELYGAVLKKKIFGGITPPHLAKSRREGRRQENRGAELASSYGVGILMLPPQMTR